MLSHIDESILSIAAVGAFFVALEVGFRLGLRHCGRGDDGAKQHIEVLRGTSAPLNRSPKRSVERKP